MPTPDELQALADQVAEQGKITDTKSGTLLQLMAKGVSDFVAMLKGGEADDDARKAMAGKDKGEKPAESAEPDDDTDEEDDTSEEDDSSEEGVPAASDGAVEGSGDKGEKPEATDEKPKSPPEPGYQDLQLGTDQVVDVESLVKALLTQNELLSEQIGLLRQEQDERRAEVKSLRKALANEKVLSRAAIAAQAERLEQLQKSVDTNSQMLGTVGTMVVNMTKSTADQLVERSRTAAQPFTPAGPLDAVTGRHGGSAPAAPDLDRVVLSKALSAQIITHEQLAKYKASRVFSDDPAENTAILGNINKVS